MSDLKTLLLHLDGSLSSSHRLEVAMELARRHGAAITALFTPTAALAETASAYSAGAALSALATGARAGADDHARNRWKDRLSSSELEVAWVEARGGTVVDCVQREAAYADLVVLGEQPTDREGGSAAPPGTIESIIVRSGRPALVVPAGGVGAGFGRRALVAWNGSAQAGHALAAALPLLRQAEAVLVLGWSRQPLAAPQSGLTIERFLARHGVSATVERRHASPHVSHEIAEAAAAWQADLVVMGCYGHGRMTEMLLGGATRSVLAAMPVATLMAH